MEFSPHIPHPTTHIFPGALVLGDVTLGEHCGVWFNAVLRGDESPIVVGDHSNFQENVCVHVSADCGVTVGSEVTVGHGAILHGCTIGDNTLIGMGAILLDGCVIGKNCIVAAGALVTEGAIIPDGTLVMGSPAKVRRPLTPEEIARNHHQARHYSKGKERYR